MKKLNVLLLIPLMLLSTLLLVPFNVHAATGTVSINGGAQVSPTPSASTVSVPITISGSDPLNGFDIQVYADPAVLHATGIDLTGSILGTSIFIVTECINGVLVVGSACSPLDGNGVVHLSAAKTGANVAGSGLLFSINYNVLGPTTSISFNTGCANTSVANTCVTISNGTSTPLSETALGASFSIVDFTMQAAFAQISTLAGVSKTDTINYASLGGYADTLTETVKASAGLTATLTFGTVDLTTSTTGSDTLTVSATANGDYTANVTATGTFTPNTHMVTVKVHVGPAGFSISLSQSAITVPRGSSDASTIVTVTGVSGFSGIVALGVVSSDATGVTGSAPSVTLTPDGSGYSTATSALTATASAAATFKDYTLTVTGSSGSSTSNSAVLTVTVPNEIQVFATPTAEDTIRGGSLTVTITVKSTLNFAGTVTLTTVITNQGTDSPGSTTNFVQTFVPSNIVTLTPGGSVSVAYTAGSAALEAPLPTATGNYTLTITATSGSITATTTVHFTVQDWSFGPTYCPGATDIPVTDNGYWGDVFVGSQCSTLTITTKTGGSSRGNLWIQTNALGGLVTHSNSYPGIGVFGPPALIGGDARGVLIPELGVKECLNPTYFANGTAVPASYLIANGPLVTINFGSGCRFNAVSWPNDGDASTTFLQHRPDFFKFNARSLTGTQPGIYTVKTCAALGGLIHCISLKVEVILAPTIHSDSWPSSTRLVNGVAHVTWGLKITNPNSFPIYVAVTIHGVSEDGTRTFTTTTSSPTVLLIPAGGNKKISLTATFGVADAGHTFSFSISFLVGSSPTSLTAQINGPNAAKSGVPTSGFFQILP